MGSIETALDREIEAFVYEEAEPADRVRRDHRLRSALVDVVNERRRQEFIGRTKREAGIDWRSCADPDIDGGDGTRFLVLGEEVDEVANAILEATYAGGGDDTSLRAELVQVAAVAIAWVEAIDRRREP